MYLLIFISIHFTIGTLTPPTSNNITSQPVNVGQLGNPSHLATPSLYSNLWTPQSVIETFSQSNSPILGNSTIFPNDVISTSKHIVPPLLSLSTSLTGFVSPVLSSSSVIPHLPNMETFYQHMSSSVTTPSDVMTRQMDYHNLQASQHLFNPNVTMTTLSHFNSPDINQDIHYQTPLHINDPYHVGSSLPAIQPLQVDTNMLPPSARITTNFRNYSTPRMLADFNSPHMIPHVPHQIPNLYSMNTHPILPRVELLSHTNQSNMMAHLPNTGNIPEVFHNNRLPTLNPETTGLPLEQMFQEEKVS